MFSSSAAIGAIPAGTVVCLGTVVRTDDADAAGARFEARRYVFDA
jgi:hypothetical protein